jgi:NCAIR mutase (PurE)-related protein
MNGEALRSLLQQVANHECTLDAALERLSLLPYAEAAHTLADTHREIRTGLPEVVFARHKSREQVMEALTALHSAHGHALATHVPAGMAESLENAFPDAAYDSTSKLLAVGRMTPKQNIGAAAVICAGTSDLPVADKLPLLRASSVIIAIAGMEGALPGVVSGLVPQPVIAVPTSVGYGAGLAGFSALLTMLNACSGGMGVVNIDNGFGAAMLAIRILQNRHAASRT